MIERYSPWNGILHEVVRHAGTLYFGGMVSEDLSLDMEGQARDVMRQLGELLAANGSSPAHVLQVTVYFVDLSEKPAFDKAWKDFFAAAHLPGRAGIGVADLGPGVKVEIVVTAAVAS